MPTQAKKDFSVVQVRMAGILFDGRLQETVQVLQNWFTPVPVSGCPLLEAIAFLNLFEQIESRLFRASD